MIYICLVKQFIRSCFYLLHVFTFICIFVPCEEFFTLNKAVAVLVPLFKCLFELILHLFSCQVANHKSKCGLTEFNIGPEIL